MTHYRLLPLAALSICLGIVTLERAQAVGVPGQGTWETTLLPRDLDGNADNGPEAFYDTQLDISWLRNANVNGLMNWTTANAWASTLAVASVAGPIGGWRLPTMVDTGWPGCDFSFTYGTDCGYNVQTGTSEMAHLFFMVLGNKAYYDTSGNSNQPGWGLTNTGNFQNLLSSFYWSGLEYAPDPALAWSFSTSFGYQNSNVQSSGLYALAVRPGDVADAVPEPQTYGLMLMGMAALVLAVRRRPH